MAFLALPVVDGWAKVGRFAVDRSPGGFKPAMALLSLVQLPPRVDKGFILKCVYFGKSFTLSQLLVRYRYSLYSIHVVIRKD